MVDHGFDSVKRDLERNMSQTISTKVQTVAGTAAAGPTRAIAKVAAIPVFL